MGRWAGVLLALLIGLALVGGLTIGGQARESVRLLPGPALEVAPLLAVGGRPAADEAGGLYLTSVSLDAEVTPLEWLGARLGLGGELQPIGLVRPHGLSAEEYGELTRTQLDDSATVATALALRRAGLAGELRSSGALVTAVLPGRPAAGALRARDVIVAIDGRPVATAEEAIAAIRGRAIGEQVTVAYERDGVAGEARLTTTALSAGSATPSLGLTVGTLRRLEGAPMAVTFESGRLGGPSGGLMLTLGILDALTPGDLAHGRRVAGSGTIGTDEAVGPIDGVGHKVRGAERVGARYFLAAPANAAEARAAARRLEVVEVGTLQQALDFLATLPEA